MADQDRAIERDAHGDGADVEIAVGEFLRDQAGGHGVDTHSTQLLGQIHAEQAEAPHLGDELAIEDPELLALLVVGQQLLAGETARSLLQCFLVVGQYHWLESPETFRSAGVSRA